MSYISAEDVLPKELVEAIQQYVCGKSIYIPCKEKKVWGSQTKTKQYYKTRNQEICIKHKNGVSVKTLADIYCLSEKSIQRIIRTTLFNGFNRSERGASEMIFYHVVSDKPKFVGQRFKVDDEHPNGVYNRVYAQINVVEDIYKNPEKYVGVELTHEVDVALRELALEKVRKEKYPQYPSRMASLYVSKSYDEAVRWGEYFARIGRPTYCVAKIKVNGNCYYGDAYKCFDGTISEEENLRLAEIYWLNGPNEDGNEPITEVLVDGEIEVVEILKEINANI